MIKLGLGIDEEEEETSEQQPSEVEMAPLDGDKEEEASHMEEVD